MQVLTGTQEIEEWHEVLYRYPQQWTNPVDKATEVMEISQCPGIILDGELLGHDSLLMDLKSKIGPGAGTLDFVLWNFETCPFNGFNCFI